jgi:hypothetical protein
MRVEKKDGGFDEYEWHSIQRIDLRSGHTDFITASGGEVVNGGSEKTWISTLHDANADGSELYCSAAFQKRGDGAVSPTEYYLSRLIVEGGRIERITKLAATFL